MRHYRLVHSWPSPRLRRSGGNRYITSVFIGYIGTDSIGSFIKRFAKKPGVEDGKKSIINARRSSICWRVVGGTDNGRQKPRGNHGYDVIVGEFIYQTTGSPSQTWFTLNPKLKSTGAGRYQLLSRWWDVYRKQVGLKDFPKSQDAVALQQRLRSVALYLWLIVVISTPASNRLLQ